MASKKTSQQARAGQLIRWVGVLFGQWHKQGWPAYPRQIERRKDLYPWTSYFLESGATEFAAATYDGTTLEIRVGGRRIKTTYDAALGCFVDSVGGVTLDSKKAVWDLLAPLIREEVIR